MTYLRPCDVGQDREEEEEGGRQEEEKLLEGNSSNARIKVYSMHELSFTPFVVKLSRLSSM